MGNPVILYKILEMVREEKWNILSQSTACAKAQKYSVNSDNRKKLGTARMESIKRKWYMKFPKANRDPIDQGFASQRKKQWGAISRGDKN
jgi:hypothetical protein